MSVSPPSLVFRVEIRYVLTGTVASRHMWLFKLTLNEIQSFGRSSHILSTCVFLSVCVCVFQWIGGSYEVLTHHRTDVTGCFTEVSVVYTITTASVDKVPGPWRTP